MVVAGGGVVEWFAKRNSFEKSFVILESDDAGKLIFPEAPPNPSPR